MTQTWVRTPVSRAPRRSSARRGRRTAAGSRPAAVQGERPARRAPAPTASRPRPGPSRSSSSSPSSSAPGRSASAASTWATPWASASGAGQRGRAPSGPCCAARRPAWRPRPGRPAGRPRRRDAGAGDQPVSTCGDPVRLAGQVEVGAVARRAAAARRRRRRRGSRRPPRRVACTVARVAGRDRVGVDVRAGEAGARDDGGDLDARACGGSRLRTTSAPATRAAGSVARREPLEAGAGSGRVAAAGRQPAHLVAGRDQLAADPSAHRARVQQRDDRQRLSCGRRTGW